MLEQTGIAALVGGRADHQDIGGRDPLENGASLYIQVARPFGIAKAGTEINDIMGAVRPYRPAISVTIWSTKPRVLEGRVKLPEKPTMAGLVMMDAL